MGGIEVWAAVDFADLCDGSRRQGFFLEDIEDVVDFQTQILSALVVTVKIYNMWDKHDGYVRYTPVN